MKLPLPSLFKKKDNSDYYLTLLLKDEKIVAVILQAKEGKISIVGQGEEVLSTTLEDLSEEELLETLDKAISTAEETIAADIETEKTIFGVKNSWVEGKKIKKEYLTKLKKICESLSLSPIGFIVISEAIANLLQKEEGAPLSGILAEIGKKQVTLTLFRAGRILEQHTSEIKYEITKTVDILLHHFTVDVLPSRIILLGVEDNDSLLQEFMSFQWSKSIPFLHVPQISTLPLGFDQESIVVGAAEQMGMALIEDSKTEFSKETRATDNTLENEREDETADAKSTDESTFSTKEKHTSDKNLYTADNFGFVIDEDISKISSPHEKLSMQERNSPKFTINNSQQNTALSSQTAWETKSKTEKKRSFFSLLFLSIFSRINFSSLWQWSINTLIIFKRSKGIIILTIILLLLISGVIVYISSLKAQVLLEIEPKEIEEKAEITIRSGSPNDFSQFMLSAKEIEVSLEGSLTTDATGKKEVGEKAKGTVTIYNSNISKSISLPKGTTLTSSNDLIFLLDEAVTVASASGDASQIKSSTAKVGVTAKDIGKEYNLPSGTKFQVANEPQTMVIAKNDSAFQGGSKKEITVVSQKDINFLVTNLPQTLEEKAKNAVTAKLRSGQETIPAFTSITVTKKSFDKDVGEETKKVTLKGTVVFTTLVYNTSDIQQLAEVALKGKYSEDLALSSKGVEAKLEDIKKEKDAVQATLIMHANLLPKMNTSLITQNLTGKSVDDAQAYLKTTIPQIKNIQITLSPNIPLIPKILPRSKENITIIVKTND